MLEGQPLLVRNPVIYTPSQTTLHHCFLRGRSTGLGRAAVFGDPTGDREAAARVVHPIGELLGTRPLLGRYVSKNRALRALKRCSLVHFQGHGKYVSTSGLDSSLLFPQNEELTAREILEAEVRNGSLIVLGACESAARFIREGDETNGLIPSFLQAGASSVIAALWRVHQESAATFMERFYGILKGSDPKSPYPLASALQQASLTVRDTWDTPYHWAAYTLTGDWRYGGE
jgi:CHAT domain-containing protein